MICMAAGGIVAPSETSLFQSAITGHPRRDEDRQLFGEPLSAVLIQRTLKRRFATEGLPKAPASLVPGAGGN